MTPHPASINALAFTGNLLVWSLVCMGMLSLIGAQAGGLSDPSPAAARVFQFDIPAQDLGSALTIFGSLTGLAVMIDSSNARRPAAEVRGSYTSAEALTQLLAGTHLQARHADAQSIVIVAMRDVLPTPAEPLPAAAVTRGPDIPGVSGRQPDILSYVARVQQSLRDALCVSPQTRPGSYRLAMQLRLDAEGRVERFKLLDTTGQAVRDVAIGAIVQGLSVGEAPPAAMAQPVSILLVPDGSSARTQCPANAS